MNKWNIKTDGTPPEVISKLQAEFGASSGFFLSTEYDGKNEAKFRLRKPIKYGEQVLHYNKVIVEGEVSKINKTKKSEIRIRFFQHFLVSLTKWILIALVLAFILLGIISSPVLIIPGLIILWFGLLLWLTFNKRIDKNIEAYKMLLTEIFTVSPNNI